MTALLMYIQSEKNELKGRLCQIGTGEGKTLVTAMLALYYALKGPMYSINIITSSSVRAQSDIEYSKELFSLFEIETAINCNPDGPHSDEERRKIYQKQIVFGDLGSF